MIAFAGTHRTSFVHSSLKNAGLDRFDLNPVPCLEDAWVDDDRGKEDGRAAPALD